MSISAVFVRRPVATTLLTIGMALAGILASSLLPVSPLPQVDFPTIQVQATMPGASPETMASSVATPLERRLGQIAGVTEMTSSSWLGSTRITLQFGLDRKIDGAARDVQAAINAARVDLPSSLKSNPTYRKVNPADAPILILAMTSTVLSQGQVYDAAATVLEQRLSQVEGVGQVVLGGSSLPAVRVELNPDALFKYGIGLEDLRAALAAANANSPKGAIEDGPRRSQIYTNDQAESAKQYRSLVVASRRGGVVRLSDVGEVEDSVEDLRNKGVANGKASVLVLLYRQPGSNIIDTVDRVLSLLPQLRASVPGFVAIDVIADRSTTIRASLREVEGTLGIAVVLVIFVVFLFLRSVRAALIPSIAVPVSLLGTIGVMYLLGYSFDNLSLMALTIATGFVVDDAIVVLENVSRHVEAGMPRLQAALQGVREVGFTVVSMSVSLVAVFIPLLFMSGILGRLFREFAVTLSVAVLVSLVVSLTATPMLCAHLTGRIGSGGTGRISHAGERIFQAILDIYDHTLSWTLRHPGFTLLLFIATLACNVYLFIIVPKGFFPQQDTGRLIGGIQGDQSISFQLMRDKLTQFVSIIEKDPAVENVVGFIGGRQTNSGAVYISLKPLSQRFLSADRVIARLRNAVSEVAGARIYFQSVQDVRVGSRQSNAQYQYTMQADNLVALRRWAPRLAEALQHVPEVVDVNSDLQDKGLETDLVVDRDTASRLGIDISQIDNILYDAFGQRQVSTIYTPLNQYHVVMELAPRYWQDPRTLEKLYLSTSGGMPSGVQSTNAPAGTVSIVQKTGSGGATPDAASISGDAARNLAINALANTGHGRASAGTAVSTTQETMVPLAAIVRHQAGNAALAVNHHGLTAAATISFNLPPGEPLSAAVEAIERTVVRIGMPAAIHGSFAGTAKTFQESLSDEPLLILAALAAVYIVLGILYESYIHPLTILSTLPSAGVGAVLALMGTRSEFTIIAMIGVILLIGIVKKNAIMMVDFALEAERAQHLGPREAIRQACLIRFRPIMMTTLAAIFGAIPLALGAGDGAELRRPLGISIIGGLIISQVLTLYSTPVIYLYLDRLRLWGERRRNRRLLADDANASVSKPAE